MAHPMKEADYQALAAFRYALRRFLRFSKDFLSAEPKLTPEQYEALLALQAFSAKEGLLVGELSERLQVKHHTAVSLAEKLVARKLVTKHRPRVDRRRVYVKLTATGAALLARLAAVHRNEIRHRSAEMIEILRRLQQ
jgi:DNA-binding MarR family transcriptional regulator